MNASYLFLAILLGSVVAQLSFDAARVHTSAPSPSALVWTFEKSTQSLVLGIDGAINLYRAGLPRTQLQAGLGQIDAIASGFRTICWTSHSTSGKLMVGVITLDAQGDVSGNISSQPALNVSQQFYIQTDVTEATSAVGRCVFLFAESDGKKPELYGCSGGSCRSHLSSPFPSSAGKLCATTSRPTRSYVISLAALAQSYDPVIYLCSPVKLTAIQTAAEERTPDYTDLFESYGSFGWPGGEQTLLATASEDHWQCFFSKSPSTNLGTLSCFSQDSGFYSMTVPNVASGEIFMASQWQPVSSPATLQIVLRTVYQNGSSTISLVSPWISSFQNVVWQTLPSSVAFAADIVANSTHSQISFALSDPSSQTTTIYSTTRQLAIAATPASISLVANLSSASANLRLQSDFGTGLHLLATGDTDQLQAAKFSFLGAATIPVANLTAEVDIRSGDSSFTSPSFAWHPSVKTLFWVSHTQGGNYRLNALTATNASGTTFDFPPSSLGSNHPIAAGFDLDGVLTPPEESMPVPTAEPSPTVAPEQGSFILTPSNEGPIIGGILGAILAVLLAIIVLVFVLYFRRKAKQAKEGKDQAQANAVASTDPSTPASPSDKNRKKKHQQVAQEAGEYVSISAGPAEAKAKVDYASIASVEMSRSKSKSKHKHNSRIIPRNISAAGSVTDQSVLPTRAVDNEEAGESEGSESDSEPGSANNTPRSARRDVVVTTNRSGGGDDDVVTEGIAQGFKKKWLIPYSSLQFQSKIGQGAFGMVYRGMWRNTKVAIKQSQFISVDDTNLEEFKAETMLLLKLRPHPNVIQILGVCVEQTNTYMILELCSRGSLSSHFGKGKLNMKRKLDILKQCALGIAHLHEESIIHRDISARNVLLDRRYAPKISDFGLSRLVDQYERQGVTSSNIGPVRYMAPESIDNKSYSTKSDCWSYGVLCFEVMSEKQPFAGIDLLKVALMIRDHGKNPGIPDGTPAFLAAIMTKCFAKDPNHRPEMGEINEMFSSGHQSDTESLDDS